MRDTDGDRARATMAEVQACEAHTLADLDALLAGERARVDALLAGIPSEKITEGRSAPQALAQVATGAGWSNRV